MLPMRYLTISHAFRQINQAPPQSKSSWPIPNSNDIVSCRVCLGSNFPSPSAIHGSPCYYDRTFKGHTKRGQTATPKQGSQFGAPGNARQQNLLKNDTPMGTGIRSVSWIWSRSACGDWEPNLLWQNDNDHACLDALPKMRHQNRKVEVDQKTI